MLSNLTCDLHIQSPKSIKSIAPNDLQITVTKTNKNDWLLKDHYISTCKLRYNIFCSNPPKSLPSAG